MTHFVVLLNTTLTGTNIAFFLFHTGTIQYILKDYNVLIYYFTWQKKECKMKDSNYFINILNFCASNQYLSSWLQDGKSTNT